MKTTKQVGSNDCGLFAIAIATALAYKTDPTYLIFMQDEMRAHLADCIVQQKLTPFPIKQKARVSKPIISTTVIYTCPICKLPEGGLDMVACDKCDIWHHTKCSPLFKPNEEEWFCPACVQSS